MYCTPSVEDTDISDTTLINLMFCIRVTTKPYSSVGIKIKYEMTSEENATLLISFDIFLNKKK